jgi:methyl-accepting chemotaxis protein
LVIQILMSVSAVLVIGDAAKISFDLGQEWTKIEENGELRGNAALDMLEAVHVQAMLNRSQIEDGDPAVATLDGTMEQFSKSNKDVDIWIVMAPKVIDFQKKDGGRVLPPKDSIDSDAIKTLMRSRTVKGSTLRLSRPVVLGKGTAADERCGGCHTGMMEIENGQPLGVYSAAINIEPQIEAWHAQVRSKVIAGLVTLGVTLLVIMLLLRLTVIKPLRRLADVTGRLAGGDVDIRTGIGERKDEIGAMARALEIFRGALISTKRLEAEAEQARLHAEEERISTQRQAEADAAERLRIATSGLASGLRQLASGDLAFQLRDQFSPEFEELRRDFNASVQQLGRTLSAISEGVGTIDGGTTEISMATRDLSLRTEQQAVSLEKTVAALHQITHNVAAAAQRAQEAREVAVQANASAGRSSVVVTDAEDAMRRIEESSDKISSIIGVIDEIAFQTNLLALNAGVEAARAGEAGKGFAVVAQEVRGLAQRSATAAREIKELIQNSSNEVDSGVRLVRETGVALKTIGEQIAGINQHMDAIALSAQEQSAGLGEVNSAISNMDHVTQQNAAMVEQSNAASATLAEETAKLRGLVGQFRLGESAGDPAAALRRTAMRPSARLVQAKPLRTAAASGHTAQAMDQWEEF